MEKRQENLEDKIVKRLAENHLSIAAAESCTGGLVAGCFGCAGRILYHLLGCGKA